MSWPAAVLWVCILAGALTRGPALLYVFNIAGVFGTLQMMPGEAASANLLPQAAAAALLVAKVFSLRGNALRGLLSATNPARTGLWAAFALYAVATAFILPRLFAGQFEVVPVATADQGTGILIPSSGNATQSCYILLSFGVTLAFSITGAGTSMLRHFFWSMVVTGVAWVVVGLADLALYHAGLSSLLDPFRTASYALLTDTESEGAKRVVGLAPEASVYGSSCVNMAATLTFLRPLFVEGRRQSGAVAALIIALIGMAALSTSSTALVGLGVFAAVYAGDVAWRLFATAGRPSHARTRTEAGFLAIVGTIVVLILVIDPAVLAPLADMLNKMVFQKTATSSYVERSMWTHFGYLAFLNTTGLGAGLGSIRTSNWFVNILGSTGVLGSILAFGFILHLFTFMAGAKNHPLVRAFRLILIPYLAMVALDGTIPDIGLGAATLFGILAAFTVRPAVDRFSRPARPRLAPQSTDALT